MSEEAVGAAGSSVLVVEDDRFLRRACEVSLRQRGFTVLTAPDGEAALELIRAELPGLVLLDLLMPRMSGLELLRRLRSEERTRALPVLVISNSSREQDVAELEGLGITGYLVKANLSLEELGDTVTRILEA
jgi:two-component system phosphate regulon response regulator PhoB